MPQTPAVLFVCLGNICRSPLAEAAFRAEAARVGLEVEIDSAGTAGWHVGRPPDPRAIAVARRHGIDIGGYRGRQVQPADFHHYTHIVALDAENLAALLAQKPRGSGADISLLLDYVPGRKGQAVADPYYGDAAGFDITWSDVTQGAEALAALLSRPA